MPEDAWGFGDIAAQDRYGESWSPQDEYPYGRAVQKGMQQMEDQFGHFARPPDTRIPMPPPGGMGTLVDPNYQPSQVLIEKPVEARSYTPTAREQLSQTIQGDTPSQGRKDVAKLVTGSSGLGEGVGAVDFLPGGGVLGAQDALRKGDYQGAAISLVPGVKGIRAYHGSPHDFDKFDLSKIGTGQGAQSYGHGLYFAENPAVAADYRRMLAGEPELKSFRLGDMHIGEHNQWDYTKRANVNTLENIKSSLAEDALIDQAGLIGAPDKTKFVLDILDKKIDDYKTSWPEGLKDAIALRQQIEKQGVDLRMGKQPGKSYEVNIAAKPEQFLDWDKPLREQPHLYDVARQVDLSHLKEGNRSRVMLEKWRTGTEQPEYPVTGQVFHHAASGHGDNAARIADQLREAGIPGIKYLDEGSRNAKRALDLSSNPQDLVAPPMTSNYVVWNPDIIKIMRKFGLAGATAAPLGMGAIAAQDGYDRQ